MSDRARRPPPDEHQAPKRRVLAHEARAWEKAWDDVGRMRRNAIEESAASRSAARKLFPTPADRERQTARPTQAKPEASQSLSQPRGAQSPLGVLAK
jgi:hypothetical protein